MTINITLFIQVVNFFIAYFIISKILLVPGVKIIKNEEQIEANIHSLILKEQFKIEQAISQKKSIELQNLESFSSIKPDIEYVSLEKFSWPTIKLVPIPNDLLKSISHDLSDYLVKKVENV